MIALSKGGAVFGVGIVTVAVIALLAFNQPPNESLDEQKVENNDGLSSETEFYKTELNPDEELFVERIVMPGNLSGSNAGMPKHEVASNFSPVLVQLVSKEKLHLDIADWKQQLDDSGLSGYTSSGKKYYKAYDNKVNHEDDYMVNDFSKNVTIKELTALADEGDPAAMLALASMAFDARRWDEGDYYAFESARISGSSEPLLIAAYQRQRFSPNPLRDKGVASWFLAAYLEGNIAAAEPVEAYFRFMNVDDQLWALERAQAIVSEISTGVES